MICLLPHVDVVGGSRSKGNEIVSIKVKSLEISCTKNTRDAKAVEMSRVKQQQEQEHEQQQRIGY